MTARFAYFYFMTNDRARVEAVAPAHAQHWRSLQLREFAGGPFSDRAGGLVTFVAADRAEAQRAVDGDPFVQEGLLNEHWLMEWVRER
jgi:uncharacterized protein YciI